METTIILLLILLIVIYNNRNKSHKDSLKVLQQKIDRLLKETVELRQEVKNLSKQGTVTGEAAVKEQPQTQPETERPAVQPDETIQEPASPKTLPPEFPSQQKGPIKPAYVPRIQEPTESWAQKWWRNNPDLEKFIGENLVNKIGIAILVLGIAFFVKYAIDKNWINEAGRVSIGFLCGALLVATAYYLRKNYRSFSSVLAGGGIAVFYFTIAFAFHQYHLVSQSAAFLLMVVITAFAIAISLLYDRVGLAVIAAVGGFLTPFMVSTGEGNYVVLFTYLIILNTGLLALSFFKRWTLINTLAFLFTELIFGAWLVKIWQFQTLHLAYPFALFFATAFYLLFLGMNTIYQIKYKQAFKVFDYSLLLVLNASYFAAGLSILRYTGAERFNGLFTLGIGVVNLALAAYFFRRQQGDKNLLFLLIGLTLTFLTLTVPIQLEGRAITLFWSVEMVLLLWLFQRSRIHLFYYSSVLVSVLAFISLLMDWEQTALRNTSALALIYTTVQGGVTNMVAAAGFAGYAFLLQKEAGRLPVRFIKRPVQAGYWLVAAFIAYMTAVFGVNLFFQQSPNYEVPNVYHRLITEAGAGLLLFWLYLKKEMRYGWLGIAAVSGYLIYHLFSISLITGLRNGALSGTYSSIHLALHWVTVAGAIFLTWQAVQLIRKTTVPHLAASRLSWAISLLLLLFFSAEAEHIFISLFYRTGDIAYGEAQYGKAGLTIVWALCSFGLMWLGMRHKNKTLRIISLIIFSVALLKLFLFDLASVSEGGKIVAFILLGVLLLIISFMYQKLKKIIIDEKG